MWLAFPEWIPGCSNVILLFGLNLLLQSTLIIIVGMALLHILRLHRKGAAAKSFLLRLCLICVLLTPVVTLISSAAGSRGLRVTMALPVTAAAPEPSAPDARPSPSVSIPVSHKGQSGLAEKSSLPSPVKRIQRLTPPVEAPRTERPLSTSSGTPVASVITTAPSEPVSSLRLPAASHKILTGFLHTAPLLLSLAWALLSLFLALRAGAITLYLRYIRRLSRPASPQQIAICRRAADSLGISAPPILQNPYVTSALLVGVFRPAILLPPGINGDSMATREVFLHELAHMARRDPLWLHLCQFAKILLPFQPFLWVLTRSIEEMSDYACDDYVIRHTGENRPYAAQLIRIAQSSRPGSFEASAGTGILSSRMPFVRRIEHILDNSYSRHIAVSANEAMSFTIIFLCAVTLSGFIGFRGENTSGTAYASEHNSRQSGETLLKKLSRLHVPLTASLATLTMDNQRADASLSGKASESAPEKEKSAPETDPGTSPDPTSIPGDTSPKGETIPKAGPAEKDSGTPVEKIPEVEEYVQSPAPGSADLIDLGKNTQEYQAVESTVSSPMQTAESMNEADSSDTHVNAGWIELNNMSASQDGLGDSKSGQLKIAIPDTAEEMLRESLGQGQENPVWSPTGKLIAFTGTNGVGVWVVSARGGMPSLILDNSDDPTLKESVSTRGAVRILGFTPDGDEITYVKYISENAETGVKKEAGTKAISLTPVIENVSLLTGKRREIIRDASDGCWSPDGKYFAFVDADYYGISLLDTATGVVRRISESGGSPCFTPDGSSILYVDWKGGITNQLFSAPTAGGVSVMLSDEGYWWNPKISPNGEWVLSSGDAPVQNPYSRMLAYNMKTKRISEILILSAEAVLMGDWSPSGSQFCITLAGNEIVNGKNIHKSSIYIENFKPLDSGSQTRSTAAQPLEFKLVGNYPNPFNPSTTIRFSLPSEGLADLSIYGMNGQKIRELVSKSIPAGMHSIVWNGRDDDGKPVSSGVYIARLKMNGKVESRRMTLVK